jgi:O-antigen/teichoic acid export membrane protein
MITILLSRLLAAEESGHFFYFLSWLSLFILIGAVGLEPSITYFLASQKMSKQELLPVALYWISLILLLIGLAGIVTYHYSIFTIQTIRSGIYFISGQLMIGFFTAFFYGEHKFILPARIIFLTNMAYIIFLLYFNLFGQHPLSHKTFTDSYTMLIFFQGICMLAMLIKDTGMRFGHIKLDIRILKTLFTYSIPVFGANILIFLATRIDYWLLDYYRQDAVSVGNYIQVSRIAQLFQLFPSLLAAFLFPSVAAGKEQMNTYILKLSRIVLCMDLILILIIVTGGKFIFPLILGNSFDRMYSLFIWMIPGIISLSLLAVVSTYFSGNNRVYVNFIISLLGLVFVFFGNWFLIPNYGVISASVIGSIGYTICFLIAWLLFSLNTQNSMMHLFAFRKSDFNFFNSLIKLK